MTNRVKRKPSTLKLATVDGINCDPLVAWQDFRSNTLLWARWWLENGGELPASCHHVIVDRLAPFIAAVKAGGLALRDELLAVVPPIPTPEPAPTRNWIMPAVGRTYSMERETDEEEQVDVRSGAEPVQAPEKPLSAGPGGVTQEPGPSTGVTHQEGGVVAFPLPEGTRACGSCGRAFKPYRAGDVILFLGVSAAGVPQATGGMIPAPTPGSTA